MSGPPEAGWSLLYDDACGFCRVMVAAVLARDRGGRVRPVAIASDRGRSILGGMSEADAAASWHLYDHAEARLYSDGAVVAPLTRALGRLRRIGRLTACAPLTTRRLYFAIATRRCLIGPRLPASWKRRAARTIALREQPGLRGW